jgi:hypothetical protein
MLKLQFGDEIAIAFVNAILLALWVVLPGLLIGYFRQTMAVRCIHPEFSLRRFEMVELDRAVLLFKQVGCRLKEINHEGEVPDGFLHTFLGRWIDIRQRYNDELEDFIAHAQHLRATIVQLRHRPLQRLRSWVHSVSLRFALGHAIAAHVVVLALLIAVFHVSGQQAWAEGITTGVRNTLVWYPLDERIFYANAIATGFAAMALPVFYLVRQFGLRREYRLEFSMLKDFADTAPASAIDESQDGEHLSKESDSSEASGDESWFAVLGVSRVATIEEVKDAYKALVKLNHPDRVYGMSPAFTKLAEAETKKLNIAYQQALISESLLRPERNVAPS